MSKYSRKSLLPKKIIIPFEEPVPPPIVVQAPKGTPVTPPVIKTTKKPLVPSPVKKPKIVSSPLPTIKTSENTPVPPPMVKKLKSAPVSSSPIESVVVKIHTEERICDCCKKNIPKKAIKCPYCKACRRDTKKDIANLRIGIIIIIFCSFAIFLTCRGVCPKEKYWTWFSNGPNNYPWYEKVIDKEPKKTISPSNDIMSTMVIDITNRAVEGPLRYRWQFSISKFFTSFFGWFVVAQFIAFILATYTFLSGFSNLKRIGYKF